jgi:hypothetical protein
MRRIALMLATAAFAVAMFGGCNKLPQGIKMSLVTAELSIQYTAKEARTAVNAPWKVDPNETPQQTITRLQKGQATLLTIMEQADKNLIEVLRWSEGSQEGL